MAAEETKPTQRAPAPKRIVQCFATVSAMPKEKKKARTLRWYQRRVRAFFFSFGMAETVAKHWTILLGAGALCVGLVSSAAIETACPDCDKNGQTTVSVIKRIVYTVCALVVAFAVPEQFNFWKKKQWLPGPKLTLPFFGGIFQMVFNPFTFWYNQGQYGPISWNNILGTFVVFSSITELSRKIFLSNSPDALKIVLHPAAERLLGQNNIAFMQGAEHKELRKTLLPLFTKRAMGVYVDLQEKKIREHLSKWEKLDQTTEIRLFVRDLNVETSQSVFVGPYLNAEERRIFSENYLLLTEGFLSLPVYFPGTTLWKAVRARKRVVEILSICAGRSKENMRAKKEPQCLLDFWMESIITEVDEAAQTGGPAPPHSTDYEVGCVLLDFLFASQDASTSSLVWVFTQLFEHPDVLAKVRAEQDQMRPNNGPLTPELLSTMTYTKQVMKEVLRFRPPATMVPHVALENFQLSDNYTVPKGSLVIPSIWDGCMQGFTDADKFDPDRFSPERQEDLKFKDNYLVFGVGPHLCMGREYAMNHVMSFIAILGGEYQWVRTHTPVSHTIQYLPTIYPGDCLIKLAPRQK
eukprot:TRINITY_DN207_c0_g1_i1.p1 TRINITY_DN207_c0_g1~~TRINITY_DN207_c0_g1_i1.p1  ORF type:complete len:579 (-),score=227.01 TRINITY_DN207_c0_g1_i1:133-1869(-)